MTYNKINKPIKNKTITNFKKYKINNVDYMVKFDKFMEYDAIKNQLASLSILVED